MSMVSKIGQKVRGGDVLAERVLISRWFFPGERREPDGSFILLHGEKSGHSHRLVGDALVFRDAAQARDIPEGLYLAHVRVGEGGARLLHEEHAAIALTKGDYRLRRQRQAGDSLQDD